MPKTLGVVQAYVGLVGGAGMKWKNGAVTTLTTFDAKVVFSLVAVFSADD